MSTRTAPPIFERNTRTLVYESDTEYVYAHEPRPGVMLFRSDGWVSGVTWPITRELYRNAIARAGRITLVVDSELTEGMSSELRDAWTQFVTEQRETIPKQLLLVRSAIARMAVRSSYMLSDAPVEMFRERADFEAAVAAHLPDVDLTPLRTRQRIR